MSEPNVQPNLPEPEETPLDPLQLQRYLQHVRDNQNLMMGVVGGVAGAVIGAALWAAVAAIVNMYIGFVAIAVGFLVGYGVRYLGKGIDIQFGIVGAILAAVGVAAGNVLAVCILAARYYQKPVMSMITTLNLNSIQEALLHDFGPMDLFFYGIALWAGYKYAIRRVLPEEVTAYTSTTLAR